MNHGPLLFLAVLSSMALSWFGFVFGPYWQMGGGQPVENVENGQLYPSPRPGLAQRGAEVYRANGCYYCHSQQVSQDASDFDLSLTAVGSNLAGVGRALQEIRADLALASAKDALGRLPMDFKGLDRAMAEHFTNQLGQAGAQFKVVAVPATAKADDKPAQGSDTYTVAITSAGKTPEAVAMVAMRLRPSLGANLAVPVTLVRGVAKEELDNLNKKLTSAGAKTQTTMNLRGADMDRGWGRRRSVALDYLYDQTVMTGSYRMGPDLSNIGDRQHSRVWHMSHLYAPRRLMSEETVAGVDSLMPAYPYLFTKRPRTAAGDPGYRDAIRLPGEDFEVVPTPDGEALVAYLQSLRSGAGVYEAPVPKAVAAPAAPPPAAAPKAATNPPEPAKTVPAAK